MQIVYLCLVLQWYTGFELTVIAFDFVGSPQRILSATIIVVDVGSDTCVARCRIGSLVLGRRLSLCYSSRRVVVYRLLSVLNGGSTCCWLGLGMPTAWGAGSWSG